MKKGEAGEKTVNFSPENSERSNERGGGGARLLLLLSCLGSLFREGARRRRKKKKRGGVRGGRNKKNSTRRGVSSPPRKEEEKKKKETTSHFHFAVLLPFLSCLSLVTTKHRHGSHRCYVHRYRSGHHVLVSGVGTGGWVGVGAGRGGGREGWANLKRWCRRLHRLRRLWKLLMFASLC